MIHHQMDTHALGLSFRTERGAADGRDRPEGLGDSLAGARSQLAQFFRAALALRKQRTAALPQRTRHA